jgi:TP901 family phage tail tape measure protein
VEVILGGQFNPAGFAAFDGAVKKSAAHAATFERTGSKAGKRLEQGFTALGLSARTFAAGGVGALGLAVVGSAVKFAAFDKQLRTFQAVSGANQKQIQSLSKAAQDLGVKFGVGATQAASGATELAKGGLTVAQILGGGLQAAITLSVAGQMTLADAASTTANAMNLFGLSGSQAQHVADALSVSANATTADVSDFGMALSQAGSAAKTVGLSFNETVTALEALALAGVKNSDAGTSLKTMLLQLANPTKKAKGVMDDLGLSFFTAQGKFKTLGDVSTMLRQKLGGLTAQQRAQVAQTLAGTDGFIPRVHPIGRPLELPEGHPIPVLQDQRPLRVRNSMLRGRHFSEPQQSPPHIHRENANSYEECPDHGSFPESHLEKFIQKSE